MENKIKKFFNTLNANEIDYFILRNFENFPNFKHDIDIYIKKNQIKALETILVREFIHNDYFIGFKNSFNHSIYDDHNIRIYRIFNYETFECIQIDIFFGFSIFGQKLIKFEEIENSFEYFKNIKILKNEFSALIAFFQIVSKFENDSKFENYKNKIFSSKDFVTNFLLNRKVDINLINNYFESIECKNERRSISQLKKIKISLLTYKFKSDKKNSLKRFLHKCLSLIYIWILDRYGAILFRIDRNNLEILESLLKQGIIPSINIFTLNLKRLLKIQERGGIFLINSKFFPKEKNFYQKLFGKKIN